MALVERLMGLEDPKIPVHDFFAAVSEVINGRLTSAQVKTFLALDAAASTQYDLIAATAPTGNAALNVAQKALWTEGMHAVFVLAERRYPGYDTAAGVRTKLGI